MTSAWDATHRDRFCFDITASDCHAEQLKRFNSLWPALQASVEFFRELSVRHRLPQYFESWNDLTECLPIQSKVEVRQNVQRFTRLDRQPDRYVSTGGTSGEPLVLPVYNDEEDSAYRWLGRSWFNVTTSDRLFLLWGHSHLFGSGMRGRIDRIARRLKDRVRGYRRFSAYDLSRHALFSAYDALVSHRASYVIGYAGALDAMADLMLKEGLDAPTNLKVVIATAESFPSPGSSTRVARAFSAPVAMEYGAMETGVLAHTDRSKQFRVMWPRFAIEAVPSEVMGCHRILVTSLYTRAMPLVRYDIGDEVVLAHSADVTGPLLRFQSVKGRSNDFLQLPDGRRLHSELFTHSVKDIPGVTGFQVVSNGGKVLFRVRSSSGLHESALELVRTRLEKIDRLLAEQSTVEVVENLETTVAGKTPVILNRPNA